MSHMSPAPAIKVFGSGPHHGTRPLHVPQTSQNSSIARPMAIPNAREAPPPPLPPPRYIGSLERGEDPGWKYGNRYQHSSAHSLASVRPGSSLLGGDQPNKERSGAQSSRYDHRDSRRGSTVSAVTPIDPMTGTEGMDHSDDDRTGSQRPSISNYRYAYSPSQILLF